MSPFGSIRKIPSDWSVRSATVDSSCASALATTLSGAPGCCPSSTSQSGLPLDIVLAGPGLEELFLERAVEVTVEGVTVPVISPEDLIVAKILAGRPKDLEDVRGILRERLSSLDIELIRSTLTLLEDALSQSDLRPLFESELARARRVG